MRDYEHSDPLQPLTFDDEVLSYRDHWSLRLDTVRVIGEYTTAAGPASEDYFIVFIDEDGRSYDVPVSALTPAATEHLRDYFGPLMFALHWSTDLRSRIMWPTSLADQAVYEFTPAPPRTVGDHLRRLFGTQNLEVHLSPGASGALKRPYESTNPYRRSPSAIMAAPGYSMQSPMPATVRSHGPLARSETRTRH
jgi:hypothetical protein